MYRRILVGVDDREQSRDAVALARLIERHTGAELLIAHVYPRSGRYPTEEYAGWDREMHALAAETVERALAERSIERVLARGGGAERCRKLALASSTPARGLHELAEAEHADLIVVGSSHRGSFGRLVAGTTGTSLLHGSPCAVAVAPAGYGEREGAGLSVIGLGYDGGPESEFALACAIDLAQSVDAGLRIITIAYPPERWFDADGLGYVELRRLAQSLVEDMRLFQEDALARVPTGIECSGQVITDPRVKLADLEGIDLMLVGSRGYGPMRRVLLGSVSSQLMHAAPCPVIVVPRGAAEAVETAGARAGNVRG